MKGCAMNVGESCLVGYNQWQIQECLHSCPCIHWWLTLYPTGLNRNLSLSQFFWKLHLYLHCVIQQASFFFWSQLYLVFLVWIKHDTPEQNSSFIQNFVNFFSGELNQNLAKNVHIYACTQSDLNRNTHLWIKNQNPAQFQQNSRNQFLSKNAKNLHNCRNGMKNQVLKTDGLNRVEQTVYRWTVCGLSHLEHICVCVCVFIKAAHLQLDKNSKNFGYISTKQIANCFKNCTFGSKWLFFSVVCIVLMETLSNWCGTSVGMTRSMMTCIPQRSGSAFLLGQCPCWVALSGSYTPQLKAMPERAWWAKVQFYNLQCTKKIHLNWMGSVFQMWMCHQRWMVQKIISLVNGNSWDINTVLHSKT